MKFTTSLTQRVSEFPNCLATMYKSCCDYSGSRNTVGLPEPGISCPHNSHQLSSENRCWRKDLWLWENRLRNENCSERENKLFEGRMHLKKFFGWCVLLQRELRCVNFRYYGSSSFLVCKA